MSRFFPAFVLAAVMTATCGSTAMAKQTLSHPAPVAKGTCELTCLSRPDLGAWSKRVECTDGMDENQCDALAHSRNVSDAYPEHLKCSDRIVETCTEMRE